MLSTTHRKVTAWVALTLAAALWLGRRGAAQDKGPDFCAVRLSVTNSEGRPVHSAVADLLDKDGRIVRTENVVNGRADFCDFGFGRYSILVHDKRSQCGAAEIKGVHVIYGLTQDLGAILNGCSDEGDWVTSGCSFYVRVAAPGGQPVSGVEIKGPNLQGIDHTDKYGRALLFVTKGQGVDYTFSHLGYKATSLELTCPSLKGPPIRDLPVVLEPEKAAQGP